MKERIYTIPLSEALEKDRECLLCAIEKKLTDDAVAYYTGAAMMEPSVRIETNEKGFCAHHYELMLQSENKLSLALVLQTRLDRINEDIKKLKAEKKSSFKRKKQGDSEADRIGGMICACTACDRIKAHMEHCVSNFVYLLETEEDFRQRFLASKGLCMKHFQSAAEGLKNETLLQALIDIQKREMARLKEEIDRFVLKFDYRNADMEWNGAKDSPQRAAHKLRGI